MVDVSQTGRESVTRLYSGALAVVTHKSGIPLVSRLFGGMPLCKLMFNYFDDHVNQ